MARIPSFGQCRHLLAPQTPRVGEAVEQDYGLAFSSDLDLDTYTTVELDAHLVPSRALDIEVTKVRVSANEIPVKA